MTKGTAGVVVVELSISNHLVEQWQIVPAQVIKESKRMDEVIENLST